jgi:drug/metabolite transporter (DMT)-like permease
VSRQSEKHWWQGTAMTALSAVFFAAMAVVAKAANTSLPAGEVVLLRWLVGLLGCGLIFIARRRGPTLKPLGLLLLRGILGSLAALLYFHGIEALGVAPATVLNYCSPVYAALFAALFLNEPAGPRVGFGLFLALVGTILVTLSTAPTGRWEPSVAALGAFVSGIIGGAAIAVVRAVRRAETDAVSVLFVLCSVGMLTSAPSAITHWKVLTIASVGGAVAVGLLALVAQLLMTSGLAHTTTARGAATIQLVPTLAWLGSLVLLDEPASALAAAGTLLCVTGVLLGVWR